MRSDTPKVLHALGGRSMLSHALHAVAKVAPEYLVVVLGNALTTLDVQERNMRLAEKVFQTTRRKYEQGVGSSFEVLQADQDFQTAQGNYYQALYDALNARIGYLRAVGRL